MVVEAGVREAYGAALVELGAQDPKVVVLDADLSSSTQTRGFAKAFPDRFFNVGLAEQNMMGIASGLASTGRTVFVSTFAVFAMGRCFDQVRMSICQPSANVKIVATHGGVTVGEDGSSHQAVEDFALSCSLPTFTVVVPADATETSQAIKTAAATPGPFYIRLPRPKLPVICENGYRFVLGKASTMRQGKNATIVAVGIMVAKALEAAETLKQSGIDCRVLNMSTLKPLDEAAVIKAARETGAIVTAEEHLEHGGLGSMVTRVVAREFPVPVHCVALKNTYAKSGKPDELLQRYGLTAADIVKAVMAAIKARR
ncbi:MAG: transketolase family protein [Chloroflexi bacterium]|nr:transketolase family protein [Chloroflexota bacterium]